MAKYKIVATGPVSFAYSDNVNRLWIYPDRVDYRIISVAGVMWEDIPELLSLESPPWLGRRDEDRVGRPWQYVAVRWSLTADDFEVEIVNA
jgi:hypothetical protein